MHLKEPAGNGRFTIIPLTIDNVFSICPICGMEHQIDITDMTGLVMVPFTEHVTLQVCCPSCTTTVKKEGLKAALMEREESLSSSLRWERKEDKNDFCRRPAADSAGGI